MWHDRSVEKQVERVTFRNQTERFPVKRRRTTYEKNQKFSRFAPFIALLAVSGALFGAPSQTELMKEAKISKAQAEKTALGKVPHGAIKSEELEREHGKLIWSFDISMPKSKSITEVQVDASTGKIVSTQVETPKDQAAEAAADKKAKK
jgi:uncharacterized membrane protein YkoI